MASIISAGTTSATALNMSADTTGVLQLASNNGTVALTVSTAQNIGIGTTNPDARLTLSAPNAALNCVLTNGNIYLREMGGTSANNTLEAHIRPSAGKSGYLTFTENAIDDRWAIGIQNGSGDLKFIAGTPVAGTLRMNLTSAGLFQFNSGFGSVATAYGCRAWVNFDGTGTPNIRGSGNVSSISDNGTGQYWVNFSSAMPDTNYACAGNTESNAVYGGENIVVFPNTTGRCTVETFIGTTPTDNFMVQVVAFR